MTLERFDQPLGEDSRAILRPLPISNDDLILGKIDILHPQPQTFQQPHARTIEQLDHQLVFAL